jgi:alpha-ribazole phosphatase/probable phosphoglycerate mutase
MSEILFIRHAETDMAATFCGGRSDPELSARGRVQLAELINTLRKEKISMVYTSDLRRAHQTGIAVAGAFGVDCRTRSALREIDFGQWEGLTWEEIERQDRAYALRWIEEYPHLQAPDGEGFRDFERRVLREVKTLSIEAEVSGCPIAVVTHAGVLRTVLCALKGCSEEDAWVQTKSYCSIVRHTSVTSSLQPMGARS